ncbi:MAG: UPF0173 metal-dependent hydrolase [Herpetosiphonaceae bacterium]|nr:MAG: UPF0173 metal-dependent hydrolase [Herpetosiphonaceae bacterium]
MADSTLKITWLGHGTFFFETPGGKRLLLDPWINNNPSFPKGWEDRLKSQIDAILLTHGHFDHIGDLVDVARATAAPIVCIFDMTSWLSGQGLENLIGFNKGGTIEVAGIKVTMTDARHSSSFVEDHRIIYMGDPCGYVIEFENGFKVYHTGDTCVFGDMRIIGELYRPDLVILPIGGYFTMDPRQAAYAAKLIGARRIIPEHYGTFPILSGTPEDLRRYAGEFGADVEVIALNPGESWSA